MIRTSRRRGVALLAATASAALAVTGLTVSPAQADEVEQVKNGAFDNGTTDPWWWTSNVPASVVNGQMCANVLAGTVNPWDAIIGQNDIPLINGESYTLSFTASASIAKSVNANVQLADPPYTAEISQPTLLSPTPQSFSYTFTSATDTDRGQVSFQIGGATEPWTFCVDNVSLLGGVEPPVYVPDTGPRVRVNQVGYLPNGPKNATVVTDATDPLPWSLQNAAGTVVASGRSTPRGVDEASGQNVQTIDFSWYRKSGSGFTLTADGETSFPFDISENVYRQLPSDALQFFYIQRSGIAIDGNLVGAQYARPAGHVGVAPNTGDTDVPCQPGVCDYRLDVRGGWYDAGDHGKYVVNGGIATTQLLSIAEQGMLTKDGKLRVPEGRNGVPDVLDEARWELEFLLRMQVPAVASCSACATAKQPLAGMAHHKIHDQNWTGLPLQPQDDPQLRELHPPSTAATLNLAAVAAQAARLFKWYDKAFADRALTAARTAYDAAKAHPDIFATGADGNGGGAYDDSNVADEFYWAAAELYLTTGERKYLDAVTSSPVHTADVFPAGGFGWQAVGALGRLDLATVPSRLPYSVRKQVRQSVVDAADAYLAIEGSQAYGLPLPGAGSYYVWGSNSNILNNIAVLATAYELTGQKRYQDGALQGLDYIFGRNALNHSYVTGYGEKSSQNQHSRIYGHELDPNLPNPPVGSISGGANPALQDPFVQRLLPGCVGQFCYVDDIQSYSTNEVAINWNSALAWVAAFAANQD
jgi:endoglucanase